MQENRKIAPVVDIFAGPGGLGEGFSAFHDAKRLKFRIVLSIEKDPLAHRTLELRAFFRQFPVGDAPDQYYDYLAGKISREDLFTSFPEAAARAQQEAWHAELGQINDGIVDRRIRQALHESGSHEWVLIGGPPCQAYSLIGRARMSRTDQEVFEQDPRHQLYKHYLRILAVHRPSVFVMENVKGMLSSRLNGENIFERILHDLQYPHVAAGHGPDRIGNHRAEYSIYSLVRNADTGGDIFGDVVPLRPGDFLIKAEDFGIPQTRHRVILLGIRDDLAHQLRVKPEQIFLKAPRERTVTVEQSISDLPRLRSGLTREPDSEENWILALENGLASGVFDEVEGDVLDEIRRTINYLSCRGLTEPAKSKANMPQALSTWILDSRLKEVCNHEKRSHMRDDLYRYIFASAYARVKETRFPRLKDYPEILLPAHQNVNIARKSTSNFCDRFRVQMANAPGSTVTSHIAKDGHYYIHYDPSQCRSLTVREAARLQTFPDNYFFEGNRTQQYTQVGNAVPPKLAHLIAESVAELLHHVTSSAAHCANRSDIFRYRVCDYEEAIRNFGTVTANPPPV